MSVCKCEESKRDADHRSWYVVHRNVSYSAFNGYKAAWSDYCLIVCARCSATWRTKANYTLTTDDGPTDGWLKRKLVIKVKGRHE